MILAIDSGNTHITFGGVAQSRTVTPVFRIPTDPKETDYGYAAKIKQIFDLHQVDPAAFEGAVISNVVPQLSVVLKSAVKMLCDKDALVVGAGVKTGLHICINDPGTIAADLVASAVAAKELYPLPCIVVDLGTATTLTVVDEKSRYIGGAILPGVRISLDALASETALLPHVEICAPKRAIAANTVDSMQAGIVYGTAGSVDGLIDRFAVELATPVASIVATGGISGVIAAHCRHEMTVDETLLLKGLELIWRKNQR